MGVAQHSRQCDRAGHDDDRIPPPLLADPERQERMLSRIPLGRFGTPEEMAGAIAYLARPIASYITGQILLLDGGLTAY